MPKIAAGATNKNISLAPNGTGKVVVGTGAADATVQSDGDHNLILQTGNSTTGKIEIADGANGNIDITPNGTGEVDIAKVDIDGGAVDGVTLGTNSAVTEAQIDNINIDGNAITSTNTNGNIDLTPAGTGEVNISKVDIDGGAIDATDVTVGSGKTLDVSAGSLTTSTAQKQAIIDGATLPASLPDQSGNVDRLLTTDGTDASWTPTHKMVASTDGIQRSDGTALLSEDGSNVATLNNVTLGGSVTGTGLYGSIAVLADQKIAGTDGGTFTSGAWRLRDLNTEISDADGIVSISANRFTLQAGTYSIEWLAAFHAVNDNTTRLYNYTDTALAQAGTTGSGAAHNEPGAHVFGYAVVTISGPKEFQIEHYCDTTKADIGFGKGQGSQVDIFTLVKILKHT